METKINLLKEKLNQELKNINDSKSLYSLQSSYLGKTGEISLMMRELGKVDKEERPKLGQLINQLKEWAISKFFNASQTIKLNELLSRYKNEEIDVTLPAKSQKYGSLHPITLVTNELLDIFTGLGFYVYEGPEIENDYYCFTALNLPKDHPARDMQDTFYLSEDLLLRVQTSAGQIRAMEQNKPPLKVVVPGRVYRIDDLDSTHSPMFHQMEGLVIDKHVTLCDLKGVLEILAKKMFGEESKTRLRPSYFPFTEPSVEVDVTCCGCGGKGCKICKNTGWIEVLGAGMVHPNVIKNAGLDPEIYSGFAFGVGLERIAILKYGVKDLKWLYENDVRFLSQFKIYIWLNSYF